MLHEIYTQISNLLNNGLSTTKHPFHIACVATINIDGFPESRFLVLREANLESKYLLFQTDIRSNKINSIKSNPHAEVVFYDKESKIQVRIPVKIQVHNQDDVTLKRWNLLQHYSKLCYSTPNAPGDLLNDPSDNDIDYSKHATKQELLESGYVNFSVLMCFFDKIEYLYLSSKGHIRACIYWNDKGEKELQWLAP